jgi:excisionase family DNA binding protein
MTTGYLTVTEAAQRSGLSRSRVTELICTGCVPATFDEERRCWLIDARDLDVVERRPPAWRHQQRRGPGPGPA